VVGRTVVSGGDVVGGGVDVDGGVDVGGGVDVAGTVVGATVDSGGGGAADEVVTGARRTNAAGAATRRARFMPAMRTTRRGRRKIRGQVLRCNVVIRRSSRPRECRSRRR